MEKLIAVVQARTGSSRLPNKVMKEICGKPMLLLMLERLQRAEKIDEIVVATTTEKSDDIIVDLAEKNNFQYFRGSELDCLDRHYQAGEKFGADFIAKITSDCPLIDPVIVDRVLDFYIKNSNKYDYVSNAHPPSYPDGLDIEVFSMSSLKKAWKEAKEKNEREHTTTYIWSHPKMFRLGNVEMPGKKSLFMQERWTVDYPEDFEFVKTIYENLYKEGRIFLMDEILKFLSKRKDIWEINHHLSIHNSVH
ncbi:MAG: acylneuraminate cytidylyltransferase [Thaumarchaeota archaeon]|jgi:spore coat polysaccharide biosynthesis protein SpsF|nr:MAG: acylneuraminate cytidylyltransferase [Nitrososphaerota archaeon]